MAIWILKASVQKLISLMPYRQKLNYFFQKNITGGVILSDSLFETKLQHCKQHLDAFQKYGVTTLSKTFELGTGWYPVVPVGLYLYGADEIYTTDISKLITPKNFKICLEKYIKYYNCGRLKIFISNIKKNRIEKIKQVLQSDVQKYPVESLLTELNIHYIPGTVFKTGSKESYFNLIHSNNTLEHISQKELGKILLLFKKMISKDGISNHFIDLSDHFSHLDKSISPYNFLKYSDAAWKFIDNSIQPQNRLRINDYRNLFYETGWNIIAEELSSGEKEKLKQKHLAKKYKTSALPDLLVTHALVTTRLN